MLKARKSKAHIGNAKIRGIRGNYQLEHLKKDLFKELMSQRRNTTFKLPCYSHVSWDTLYITHNSISMVWHCSNLTNSSLKTVRSI